MATFNHGYEVADFYDSSLVFQAPNVAASTTTDNSEVLTIQALEGLYPFWAIINWSAIGGTVDGSNYWSFKVEASTVANFGSNVIELTPDAIVPATAGGLTLQLSGPHIRSIREAAGITDAVQYLRVTATETGTTAGDLTWNAHVSLTQI